MLRRSLSGLLLLLLVASAGLAATEDRSKLELTTERLVVFKDGHGLIVKRGTAIASDDGTVFTDEVPDSAVLGTFWVTASRGRSVRSMVAEWVATSESLEEPVTGISTRELLRANTGRRVSLRLRDDRELAGTIMELLERAPDETISAPRRTIEPAGGSLVLLRSADGTQAVLPVDQIHSISADELQTTTVRTTLVETRSKRLTVTLDRAAAGTPVELHMIYFSDGVRWIPTYRLEGDLDARAQLSLQGEILNEVEDFIDVELDLVVGVPNFRFRDTPSPLTLETAMRRALQQTAPGLMSQALSNASFQSRAGEWRADRTASVTDPAPELATGAMSELFVYRTGTISVPKGARAVVALWDQQVEPTHLYTLDLDIVRNGQNGATTIREAAAPGNRNASPTELSPHRVWHQLELTNGGDVPWTTGAALVIEDRLPLCQELLTYTPVGAASLLPITVAVDVRASHAERELERVVDAVHISGSAYTRVTKSGTISLTNHKSAPITLRINASTGGIVSNATQDGTIRVDDYRAADWDDRRHVHNNHSQVDWRVELAGGETREFGYTVSFLVR